jgi:hypothetical protein
LAVPAFAAAQADHHARNTEGRIVPGPRIRLDATGGDCRMSAHDAARTLLRGVYPLLAEDLTGDGPMATASAAVRTARAQERRARRPFPLPDPALTSRDMAFVWWRYLLRPDGSGVWVPDDEGNSPSEDASDVESATDGGHPRLEEVWEGSSPALWWGMLLHLETGPRGDTALHTLYGSVAGWDPGRRILRFTSPGGTNAWDVPVHRIVALTGHQHRDDPPLWRPYTAPAHQHRAVP